MSPSGGGEDPQDSGNLIADTNGPITVLDNSRHNAFGGGYQRTNGDLVQVWREGPTHDVATGPTDRGQLYESVSADDGATWGTPAVFYTDSSGELDARDPTVARLANGDLLCTFFLHSGAETGDAIVAYAMKSTDQGATWGSPVPLNAGLAAWDAVSNPPVELANGDILVPCYGKVALGGGAKQSVTVTKSTDGGASFGSAVTVGNGPSDGRDYQEPALLLDPATGDLLCVMRTNGANFYVSRSTDDGATWSAPTDIGFASNGRPCLGYITRGATVLMYRAAAAMHYRTSWDFGQTWTASAVILDNTDSQKSAYAQLVEASEDVLAVFYFMQQSETEADARFTYLHPTDLDGVLPA